MLFDLLYDNFWCNGSFFPIHQKVNANNVNPYRDLNNWFCRAKINPRLALLNGYIVVFPSGITLFDKWNVARYWLHRNYPHPPVVRFRTVNPVNTAGGIWARADITNYKALSWGTRIQAVITRNFDILRDWGFIDIAPIVFKPFFFYCHKKPPCILHKMKTRHNPIAGIVPGG